jgi:hypothetical protein
MLKIALLPIIHSPTKTTIFSLSWMIFFIIHTREHPGEISPPPAPGGLPGTTFFGILKGSAIA